MPREQEAKGRKQPQAEEAQSRRMGDGGSAGGSSACRDLEPVHGCGMAAPTSPQTGDASPSARWHHSLLPFPAPNWSFFPGKCSGLWPRGHKTQWKVAGPSREGGCPAFFRTGSLLPPAGTDLSPSPAGRSSPLSPHGPERPIGFYST